MPQLNVYKESEYATLPVQAHPEDACWDLHCCLTHVDGVRISRTNLRVKNSPLQSALLISEYEEKKETLPILKEGVGEFDPKKLFIFIPENSSAIIPTGLRFGIPQGYRLDARSRSGNAAKRRLFLTNGVGTIDSGYDQEVYVILTNNSGEHQKIYHGDRIAQIKLEKVLPFELSVVSSKEDLYHFDYSRTGGLGSTGQ